MNWENFLASFLTDGQISQLLPRIGKTFVVLVTTVVVLYFARKALSLAFRQTLEAGSGGRRQRIVTVVDTLYHFLSLILWFISGLTILSGWDINVTPLLTGAGLLGIAVGLGSQTLIKDLVAGLFIILENQYNQGDTIGVAGVKGRVERISLRMTALRDENNNVIIVPNSAIQTVTRYQKE
ncbi:MAG: mechanosensitive ion channel domain-containing protein [Patescibacteria group bacterium]